MMMLSVSNLEKSFHLHQQNNAHIPVLSGAQFDVAAGECVALTGPSGCGKSSLMRMIYGNYRADSGSIRISGTDVVTATPREVMALRRGTIGYVSQFLRVLPRVPTLRVVAEPYILAGGNEAEAEEIARELLLRLRIPETLWQLSPLTFSGGEQQRVNIVRGFVHPYPVLLLDEPTASLDAANRDSVLDLIVEAKQRGAAVIGIFHDALVRDSVADREIDVSLFGGN